MARRCHTQGAKITVKDTNSIMARRHHTHDLKIHIKDNNSIMAQRLMSEAELVHILSDPVFQFSVDEFDEYVSKSKNDIYLFPSKMVKPSWKGSMKRYASDVMRNTVAVVNAAKRAVNRSLTNIVNRYHQTGVSSRQVDAAGGH